MRKILQLQCALGTLLLFMLLSSNSYSQTWQQKADFGGGPKFFPSAFSIGTKGYMGLGSGPFTTASKDFWEYDPATNVWTQIADFAGTERRASGSFAVGGKGYVGAGWDGITMTNDFWEYNPSSNAWARKADFPGAVRRGARGEAVGAKGYMGFGWDGLTAFSDFYEYDPSADAWTRKADYAGGVCAYPASFVIGAKAYFGTGFDGANVLNSFYEYDPAGDAWTKKADYAGTPVQGAVGFSIGTNGYVGTGRIDPFVAINTSEFWQWNQSSDTWTATTNYPILTDVAGSFSVAGSGKAYVGSGGNTAAVYEFTPCIGGGGYPTITFTGSDTLCSGSTISLTANNNSSYLWSTGETTQTINPVTLYGPQFWVVNPDQNNCISAQNTIQITNILPWYISSSGPLDLCNGESVTLTANAVYTQNDFITDFIHDGFVWSNGETTESITVSAAGTYNFSVYGCSDPLIALAVSVHASPANDNICNAQNLTIGAVTAFNNFCATTEPGEPVPPLVFNWDVSQDGWGPDNNFFSDVSLDHSVWFSFIAPSSGAVTILVDGFDSQLALYSSSDYSCKGALSLISANDDGSPSYLFGSFINRAFCLKKGKRYFVQVDGWNITQGSGTILVTSVSNTTTICHNVNHHPVTLSVSGCAVAAHLAHGDQMGSCFGQRLSATEENDITSLSLLVYPNPATEAVNISFTSDKEEPYSINIIDMTGRMILSETKDAIVGEIKSTLNLQNLSAGIYFLTIKKGENIMQTRIVKE